MTTPRRGGRAGGVVVALFVLVSSVTACGSVSDSSSASIAPSATTSAEDCPPPVDTLPQRRADGVSGQIRVLAAASLTGSFGDLAAAFERAEPAVKVATSFGASSSLVARIHEGAPADVLATADTETMAHAVDAHDVRPPVTFTCNSMTILTAKGNPLDITGLADLGRPDVRFALCAEVVPCGRLGRAVLTNAGVDAEPAGSEANVKAVVAKVISGELDAGIVYATDALAAGDAASSVDIPTSVNVTTAYEIAVTSVADRPEAARAFVDFVRSPAGQEILDADGFGAG